MDSQETRARKKEPSHKDCRWWWVGMASGETTNESSGLIGGSGWWGGWCRGQKNPPTSHKYLLVAVVGCKVGAQNTDAQPCIRVQGRQDPEYPIWPLLAMAPSRDPTSLGVKRTSPINRTCNLNKVSISSPMLVSNCLETGGMIQGAPRAEIFSDSCLDYWNESKNTPPKFFPQHFRKANILGPKIEKNCEARTKFGWVWWLKMHI